MLRSDIRTIFLREIRDILRDRRAIFAAFVLPLILYPVMFLGSSKLKKTAEKGLASREIVLVLRGNTEGILPLLRETGPLRVLSEEQASSVKDEDLSSEKVQAILTMPENPESAGKDQTATVRYFGASDFSREALERISDALGKYQNQVRHLRLVSLKIDPDPATFVQVEKQDLATASESAGASIGRLIPFLLILALISGGSIAAVDVFAGERERGTLETLLVQPVKALDIVTGKFLAVLFLALAATCVNLVSLVFSLQETLPVKAGVSAMDVSAQSLLFALLILIPVSLFLTALLVAITGRARSFREGQQLVSALSFGTMIPAMVSVAPGIPFTPFFALIPITGPAIALREVFRGSFPPLPIALVVISSLVYTVPLLFSMAKLLDAEKLLRESPPEVEKAQGTGSSRRTIIGAAIATLLVYYLGTSFQAKSPKIGFVLTEWVLIVGSAFLLLRSLKLPIREGLGLQRTPLASYAAATLLALGAAMLAVNFLPLQNKILPAPEEFLKTMGSLFGEISTWEIIFVAISAGICEELLARGPILFGVMRDSGKISAVLWSSLFFAGLHFSVFRLPITFAIGAMLGAVRIRSGSIYPAIVCHVLYDAILMLAGDRIPLGWESALGGVALTLAGLFLLRSSRRPAN